MGKTDAKGEPVQTVTIGGRKVDVPIIFILPEESGSKEIERYLHPKVHIESKKGVPLLAGAGAAAGIGTAGAAGAGAAAGGIAAAGKKIGEGVKNTVGEGIGAVGDAAKLSETLSSESEEKPLEELTHGKLEEVEKLPFPVPKEKKTKRMRWRGNDGKPLKFDKDGRLPVLEISQAEEDERDAFQRFAFGSGFPQERGVKDSIVAGKEEMPRQKEISHTVAEANKAKKKKKKDPLLSNSWEALRDEWSDVLPDESKKDCKGGKCSKKPSKPDYDPSKVADEKYFKTEAEARGVKGATSVLRHRSGLFTPVFGDKKELDRIYSQLKDHNDKNPSPLDEFDPEQSISDLSGESQEKAKGLDEGDDDPRRHGRKPDIDHGEEERKRQRHKETFESYLGSHTDEEKEDIRLARHGGKGGKVALPMVERKVRGESRPSLYGETVGHRSLRAGLTPEQTGQNMAMATISEENAETYKSALWKSWLQKQQWYSDDDREEDSGKRSVNALELIADDWTKREGGKGVPKSRVGGTMRTHGRDHTGKEINRKEPVGEHDRVSELGYARGKEFWDKNPKLDEKTRHDQADSRSYGLTISPENAELWKSWLQKRDDWDKEEKENTDRHFGRKLRENEGTKRGIKEGLYEELADPKLEGNIEDEALVTLESGGKRPQSWGGKKIHYTDFDVEGDLKTGKKLINETAVTPSRVVGTGRHTPHSALAEDARHSDGSEALNITQGNAKLWKSWLENKSLGALGWGKLNRDGTKQKLRKRKKKPKSLDDFMDDNGDKKDET